MGCLGLKTVSTTKGKMMMRNPTKKKSLIASAIFVAFVSTVFAGCYYDRTTTGGYHRDLHGDYSYYDRDWRDDSYYRWHDYRDRDDRSSWNRIDPCKITISTSYHLPVLISAPGPRASISAPDTMFQWHLPRSGHGAPVRSVYPLTR
jgi:hypothetical protein